MTLGQWQRDAIERIYGAGYTGCAHCAHARHPRRQCDDYVAQYGGIRCCPCDATLVEPSEA